MIRLALLLLLAAGAARAERVVAALDQSRIAISSDFSGSEIFVYGALAGVEQSGAGTLGVVIAVTGPPAPVVVRRKDRLAGIWTNAESARLAEAPSYFALASTGRLFDTISHTEDLRHSVSLERTMRLVDGDADQAARDDFVDAAIRLRQAQGRFVLQEGGVQLLGGVLFRARFPLPANIVEGVYSARVFLTRERVVVDSFRGEVAVRKVGIERILSDLAEGQPLLYGLFAVMMAAAAGVAASEAFRWFKR